jgi:3D (Asp-Asp-Asp) domain-containing protein
MRFFILSLMLFAVISCGKKENHGSQMQPQVVPTEGKSFEFPDEFFHSDSVKIADLLPTMYYTPKESEVHCKGRYGSTNYTGREIQKLITPDGKYIATVCKRFASVLLMEGSGILKDRGHGEIAVNYARQIGGLARYHLLGRCKYGEGIRQDLCLLPYHTIAADNRIHKINDIIYIPEVRGVKLPDGSTHEGYFIVRDTGGAFNGIGAQRVDLFVGTDPDYDNAFQKAGFHHKRAMDAFKITGDSADRVREKLRQKFGILY